VKRELKKRPKKNRHKRDTQRNPQKSVFPKNTHHVSKKTYATCFQKKTKKTPKRPTKQSTIETQHEHTPVSIWTAIMQLRDSVLKIRHTTTTWRQKRAYKRDPKKT